VGTERNVTLIFIIYRVSTKEDDRQNHLTIAQEMTSLGKIHVPSDVVVASLHGIQLL
jgi:hypothetical protein